MVVISTGTNEMKFLLWNMASTLAKLPADDMDGNPGARGVMSKAIDSRRFGIQHGYRSEARSPPPKGMNSRPDSLPPCILQDLWCSDLVHFTLALQRGHIVHASAHDLHTASIRPNQTQRVRVVG